MKPDARAFQSERQFFGVGIEKTLHGYDRHAFALIAFGGDRLRAVAHYKTNV
jgi:hypothetical protein